MTTKKDGGPAFPTSEPKYGQMINVGAMSLRDWFAGKEFSWIELQVIGNIFENPELLEGK